DVVALVDTSLLRLGKEACDQLIVQCPPFSLRICRILGERLVESGREVVRGRAGRDAVLDDLFAAQSSATRSLLLRASVLPTITPDARAAVLGSPGDVDALRQLAERYPRLVRATDGAFTLHASLRAFLLSRLARQADANGSAGLHGRAAAYFEEREEWG